MIRNSQLHIEPGFLLGYPTISHMKARKKPVDLCSQEFLGVALNQPLLIMLGGFQIIPFQLPAIIEPHCPNGFVIFGGQVVGNTWSCRVSCYKVRMLSHLAWKFSKCSSHMLLKRWIKAWEVFDSPPFLH